MTPTTERTVTHSTFTIRRHYTAKPDRVFAAFADPEKKRRWFAPRDSRDLGSYEMDFRVGGTERSASRMKEGTPFPGAELVNQTTYQDIVPDARIVMAYTMAMDGRRFSASLATIAFVPTGDGTDLVFTEQGAYFEGSDGPRLREQGWTKILEKLDGELAG